MARSPKFGQASRLENVKLSHSLPFLFLAVPVLSSCAQAPPCACPAEAPKDVQVAPASMSLTTGVIEEFAALSLEDRVGVLPAMRANLEMELGLVSGDPRPASSGHNRIITRGLLDGMTIGRGGGAYFSFETGLNDYNQGPDLELQGGEFQSGFYGGCVGAVHRLEGVSFAEVSVMHVPEDLRDARGLTREASRNYPDPRCKVGEVYVVRSDRAEEYDVLAAFRVTEVDAYGAFFDWRVLKVY